MVARVVRGTLMLPFGFFFSGTFEWVAEIKLNMSLTCTSVVGRAAGFGTRIAFWLRDEITSAIDLELVITSGLKYLTGCLAQSLGSKVGLVGELGSKLGVSCTGGKPNLANFFCTRGSLVVFAFSAGGVSIRLGVSTTGGLPNVALPRVLGRSGVGVGVGVGEAGEVVVVGVVVARVCRGGGSCVGIL